MTRLQFLNELYRRLGGLSQEQAEEYLSYYAEMLADRMEEVMTEEEAVESMEDVGTIARRILQDEGVSWQPPRYPDPPRTQNTYHPLQTRNPALDWRVPAKAALWALAIVVAGWAIFNRLTGYVGVLKTTGSTENTPLIAEATITEDIGILESASELPADVRISPEGLYVWDGEYEVAISSEGLRVNGADGVTQFYIGPDGFEIGGEYSGGWESDAQG